MNIRRKIASLICLSLFCVQIPIFSLAKDNITEIYVANTGNDANEGSIDSPVATIEKARDEIREMKKNGTLGANGAVVYIREGTYPLKKSLDFTAEDSGTENAHIVYRSYRDEKVKVMGGIEIPTDKFTKVTDEAVLSKLIDEKAKDTLYEINFDDIGIDKNFAALYLNESYGTLGTGETPRIKALSEQLRKKLNMPEVRSAPLEMYADGQSLENARYPNEGYMHIKKATSTYSLKSSDLTDENKNMEKFLAEQVNGTPSGTESFISDDAHAKVWAGRTLKNVILSGNLTFGWSTECLLLKEVKDSGEIVSAVSAFWPDPKEGDPFYIYNFLDEISTNEYYFDMDNEKLYCCFSRPAEKLSQVRMASMQDPLFNFNEAQYIDVKGIHFSFTAGECINIDKGKNISADNCEFSETYKQNRAVYIGVGSYDCGVKNSYFHDVNGGVRIYGGDVATLTKGNCYVTNCEFNEFSSVNKTGTIALHIENCGNIASYNKIHGGDHQSVSWGGFFQTIQFNEIYDVCRNTNDAAAMYAGQSWVPRGNVLKYNYIHDIGPEDTSGKPAINGIYLDDCYSSADVVGNVIVNVPNYGIFLGGGRDNVIFNNIVINSGGGIFCDARAGDNAGPQYQGRIANYKAWGDVIHSELFQKTFPEMANLDLETAGTPAGDVFRNNVIYNSGGITLDSAVEKNGTVENNWITKEDPGFADMEKKNYTMKADAKAASKITGFIPIPFTRMGMCTPRAEARIKAATVIEIDSPLAFVNGTRVNIDDNEKVIPMIKDDKTYLPVRFLAESNGFTVSYDNGIAKIGNSTTELAIDTSTGELVKNGEKADEKLDVIVENDRTMLPMRVICEMLGKQVFWDDRGFVAVSDIKDLFDSAHDAEIIDYIYSKLDVN